MNTRASVQLVSDQILDYFIGGNFPPWNDIYKQFVKDGITTLNGTEKFSKKMLKELFKNDENLIGKIEFFNGKHFHLIRILLKDVYYVDSCIFCNKMVKKEKIECSNVI